MLPDIISSHMNTTRHFFDDVMAPRAKALLLHSLSLSRGYFIHLQSVTSLSYIISRLPLAEAI